MYKRDFDNLSQIPNSLLFYGDKFYLDLYEEKLSKKFKDENILKIYFDEFNFDEVKSYLAQGSLFGEKNVIFYKTKKLDKKLEKLASKENYLFIFYYGDKKPNLKMEFVRFFTPTLKDIVVHIDELAKKLNLKLSHDAKIFLAKSVEPSFLRQELEKLSTYKNEIDLNDVKELVFVYKEESFEEIFMAILRREEFFDKLNQLLEKIDFRRFLAAFIKYLSDLYEIYLFVKTTGNSSLKELLGYQLPKDIEQSRVNLAIGLKEKEYLELFDFLLDRELKMRTKSDEAIFLEVIAFLKSFRSF